MNANHVEHLEDVTESWKAETLEKMKGTQSQDTLKRVGHTHGTTRASAVWGW